MPRDLDSAALAGLTTTITAPGYLVEITAGEMVLRYSSRGTLDFGGVTWTGGGMVTRQSPTDWTLSLPNYDNLASALVLGDLLEQATIVIWHYLDHLASPQAIQIFSGFINQCLRITTTRVEISLAAVSPGRSWLPDGILAPPLLNYLPPAGTAITWGGTTYYLEPAV